jgi:hypothetical protein
MPRTEVTSGGVRYRKISFERIDDCPEHPPGRTELTGLR